MTRTTGGCLTPGRTRDTATRSPCRASGAGGPVGGPLRGRRCGEGLGRPAAAAPRRDGAPLAGGGRGSPGAGDRREWRHAWRAGGHPRGVALVAAAVDLTRAGRCRRGSRTADGRWRRSPRTPARPRTASASCSSAATAGTAATAWKKPDRTAATPTKQATPLPGATSPDSCAGSAATRRPRRFPVRPPRPGPAGLNVPPSSPRSILWAVPDSRSVDAHPRVGFLALKA